jgi:hypothetical protein
MLPNDYDYHHIYVETLMTTRKTDRQCQVCQLPIYKEYKIERLKETGYIISKILTWNSYFTCSPFCKTVQLREAKKKWELC